MKVAEMNPFVRFAGFISLAATPMRSARDQRLFYVQGGNVKWEICGKEYHTAAGAVLFIPAGTPYRMEATEQTHLIAVNFDFTQDAADITATLATLPREEYEAAGPLEKTGFSDRSFGETIFLHNHIPSKMVEKIASEYTQKKIYFREKASAMMKELLLEILRLSVSENAKERTATDRMISYIQENYMNPITNQDVAEHVRYHEYHANRLMLKHTGTTIHKYLTNCRIDSAKVLLTATELSVGEIAEQTGMGTASRFSEAFKRMIGVSPSEYRKQNFRLI